MGGIKSSVRELVLQEDEIFVVTGPIYPADADLKQIGEGVLVPTSVFKAIYVPSMNAASAYVAPNTPEKAFKVMSIEDLKAIIDADVFPKLSQEVKKAVMDLPPPQPPEFHCRVHNTN